VNFKKGLDHKIAENSGQTTIFPNHECDQGNDTDYAMKEINGILKIAVKKKASSDSEESKGSPQGQVNLPNRMDTPFFKLQYCYSDPDLFYTFPYCSDPASQRLISGSIKSGCDVFIFSDQSLTLGWR